MVAEPGPQPDSGPRTQADCPPRGLFGGPRAASAGQWFAPLADPDSNGPEIRGAAGPAGSGSLPGLAAPSSAGEALQMALAGLGWLARADMASMPVPAQAECLRGLEHLQSFHTAARALVLTAFTARGGYEDDGVRHEAPVLTGPG